jgi:hypothetical protein
VISSGRSFIGGSCLSLVSESCGGDGAFHRGVAEVLPEGVEAVAHGAVHHRAADAQHEAADDLGVDGRGQVDLVARVPLEPLDQPASEARWA